MIEAELIHENQELLNISLTQSEDRAHWQRAAYALARQLANTPEEAERLVKVALAQTEVD